MAPKISTNLDWPDLPDPTGVVVLLDEDTVIPKGCVVMTYEYWKALVLYIIGVERVHEIMSDTLER